MRLVNGAGTKSFQKLCQEHHIPPEARAELIVIRDAEGPVWIEGFGAAHRCRITEDTTTFIRVTRTKEGEVFLEQHRKNPPK